MAIDDSKNLKIIIGVITHKKLDYPIENGLHRLVGVGPVKTSYKINDGDYNHLNPYYSEVSGILSLNNLTNEFNYIGISHYRRLFHKPTTIEYIKSFLVKFKFFASKYFGNLYRVGNYVIQNNYHSYPETEVQKITNDFEKHFIKSLRRNPNLEAVLPLPTKFSNRRIRDIFEKVGYKYIDELILVISKLYPSYLGILEKTIEGNYIYPGNMMIIKSDLYIEYCDFLQTSLNEFHSRFVSEESIKDDNFNKIYGRIPGYMAEILTHCFIVKNLKNKSILHAHIAFIQ